MIKFTAVVPVHWSVILFGAVFGSGTGNSMTSRERSAGALPTQHSVASTSRNATVRTTSREHVRASRREVLAHALLNSAQWPLQLRSSQSTWTAKRNRKRPQPSNRIPTLPASLSPPPAGTWPAVHRYPIDAVDSRPPEDKEPLHVQPLPRAASRGKGRPAAVSRRDHTESLIPRRPASQRWSTATETAAEEETPQSSSFQKRSRHCAPAARSTSFPKAETKCASGDACKRSSQPCFLTRCGELPVAPLHVDGLPSPNNDVQGVGKRAPQDVDVISYATGEPQRCKKYLCDHILVGR
jgi:hypothetical protein